MHMISYTLRLAVRNTSTVADDKNRLRHYMNISWMLLLFVCCLGCDSDKAAKPDTEPPGPEVEIPFDKKLWEHQDGLDYPYRVQMYKDILYNDTVRSLNKSEILELLGEPSYDRDDKGFLYYTISKQRAAFWTVRTKTLVIKLAEDNTVEWIKLHE